MKTGHIMCYKTGQFMCSLQACTAGLGIPDCPLYNMKSAGNSVMQKTACFVNHFDLSHFEHMMIGIVSDTHGHMDTAVRERLHGCGLILHAGDIGSSHVLHQLRDICPVVIPVRGNNDCIEKWPPQDHSELATIGNTATVKLPGGSIALTHGDRFNPPSSRHEKLRRHFAGTTAIVYGHSHELVCDQEVLPWVLNPGAAGKTRTKGGASCLLVSAGRHQWEISKFRARKPAQPPGWSRARSRGPLHD